MKRMCAKLYWGVVIGSLSVGSFVNADEVKDSKDQNLKSRDVRLSVSEKRVYDALTNDQQSLSLFNKGKEHYEKKDYIVALDIFEMLIALQPGNHVVQGYVKLCQDMIVWEEKQLDNFQHHQQSEKINDLYQQGIQQFKGKKYKNAVSSFEEILSLQPDHKWAKEYLRLSKESLTWQEKIRGSEVELEEKRQAYTEYVENQKKFEEFFERGKQLFLNHDFSGAMNWFKEALKLDPTSVYASEYLKVCERAVRMEEKQELNVVSKVKEQVAVIEQDVNTYYEQLRKDELLRLEAEKEELQRKKLSYEFFKKAKDLFAKKDYLAAQKEVRESIRLNPDEVRFRDYLKICEDALSLETDTVERMRWSVDLAKDIRFNNEVDQKLTLVKDSLLKNNYTAARKILERLNEKDPNNALILDYLRVVQEAIVMKSRIERRIVDSMKERVYVQEQKDKLQKLNAVLAQASDTFEKKEYEIAYNLFIKAAYTYKDDDLALLKIKEAFFYRAQELYENADYEFSLRYFRSLAELDPKDKFFVDYVTLCEQALSQKQESIRQESLMANLMQKYKQLEEAFAEAKKLQEDKQYLLSNQKLKEILEIDPSFAVAQRYIDLNNKYLHLQQVKEEEALKQKEAALEKIRSLQKDISLQNRVEEMFKVGKNYFQQKNYNASYSVFEEVLKLKPEYQLAIDFKETSAAFLKAEEEKKRAVLDTSIEKHQLEVQKFYEEGIALFKKKQYEEALIRFENVWKLDPNVPFHAELQLYIENSYRGIEEEKAMAKRNRLKNLYLKAKALFDEDKWEDALTLFQQIQREDSGFENVSLYIQLLQKAMAKQNPVVQA